MPSATTKTLTDQLRRDYSYVLFQISQNLGREHTNKFRRLCTGHISNTNTTEITSMFHCFEHEGLISWKDINYLKDLMRKIRRFDIEREVTEFEIKRDLKILLDFYARKRQGQDLSCCSQNVRRVAGYLTKLTDKVRDRVDITNIISSVKSSKDIRNVLVEFEEEMDCRRQKFSWDPDEFMMLVVIAGELLAIALASETLSDPVMELYSTAADELCLRIMELKGNWREFSHRVEERYNQFYRQQKLESNPCLSMQRKRVEILQHLSTIFSPQKLGSLVKNTSFVLLAGASISCGLFLFQYTRK